jgi:pyruvate dehydrogenase E2 component (dihydrolipoamide acetyltransferase)
MTDDGQSWTSFTSVERFMARRMQAVANVPLSHQWVHVDVGHCLDLVAELRQQGMRVTFNALVVCAVAKALAADPAVAAVVDYESFRRRVPDPLNVGVAVNSTRGLVVPVVRGVTTLSFAELVQATNAAVDAARDGSTDADLYSDGHITVTNLGKDGVDGGIPLPVLPQIAILGVSSARKTPVVRDDVVTIGRVARFGVSLDHRALDGVTVARFLQAVQATLEEPPAEWSAA